jgi:serine/threonine protein kinase
MSLVGETLGHFRITRLLGSGSMAEVYLAIHEEEGYEAAIKVIHPHLISDSGFLERFKREAKILSELDHPHIIHVYESVVNPSQAYIIMEYLSGGTLAEKLNTYHNRREVIPIAEMVQIIEPIASAVDYAHERGLVHRDLKPANILFRGNDDPVLTDFGLAFLMNDPRLSASNTITGTPAYLSPEQAKGMAGDARSDVYALGIILYEMFSGYTPFQGNVISIVMKHISEQPPSIRSFGRYLPKKVEDIVFKALEKQPHLRYQSAQFLTRELRKMIEKTMPDVLKEKSVDPQDVEWEAGKGEITETQIPPVEQQLPEGDSTIQEGGSPEPEEAKTIANERLLSEEETSSEEDTMAPQTETAAAAETPFKYNPMVYRESMPGARRASTQIQKKANSGMTGIMITLGVFTALTILILLAGQIFGGFGSSSTSNENSVARFNVGQRTVISIPNRASTSMYDGCHNLLTGRVLGVASDGQLAVIQGRQKCGDEWYYKVLIREASSDLWDGSGFVAEKYLK